MRFLYLLLSISFAHSWNWASLFRQTCTCQESKVIHPVPLSGITLDLGCDSSLSFVPEKITGQERPNYTIIFKSGYVCAGYLELKLEQLDGTTKTVVSILNPKEEYRAYETQIVNAYIAFKSGNYF
jgi:hypothetical protein